MGYEAALDKQPEDRRADRDRDSDAPTVEVELGGRKVRIRQQTVPSGIGYGIARRLKRWLG
jgi:hypothetical protein